MRNLQLKFSFSTISIEFRLAPWNSVPLKKQNVTLSIENFPETYFSTFKASESPLKEGYHPSQTHAHTIHPRVSLHCLLHCMCVNALPRRWVYRRAQCESQSTIYTVNTTLLHSNLSVWFGIHRMGRRKLVFAMAKCIGCVFPSSSLSECCIYMCDNRLVVTKQKQTGTTVQQHTQHNDTHSADSDGAMDGFRHTENYDLDTVTVPLSHHHHHHYFHPDFYAFDARLKKLRFRLVFVE